VQTPKNLFKATGSIFIHMTVRDGKCILVKGRLTRLAVYKESLEKAFSAHPPAPDIRIKVK
jgi:hypothetical protein